MRRLALIAVAACSNGSVEPLRPFQIPRWTTAPDDEAIVRSVVGTEGSVELRTDAETITRGLLLPRLRQYAGEDPEKLRAMLEGFASMYETFRREALGDEFLRFAVSEALVDLRSRAGTLAVMRIQQVLWPSEPLPDSWRSGQAIQPATSSMADALVVHYQMRDLEGRYSDRLPVVFSREDVEFADGEYGEHRSVVLTRNLIYIALTGDYTLTAGAVYDELVRRGISTRRVPEDRPY